MATPKWLKKVGEFLKDVAPSVIEVAGNAVGGGVLGTLVREVVDGDENTDLDSAVEKIFGSPELRVKLEELAIRREKQMQDFRLRELELEAKELEIVNATIRAELGAEDPWSRRWRPYFGFVAGTAFGLQILGVVFVMVTGGNPALLAGVTALTPVWTPALAVLGITSWGRSSEKKAKIENGGKK